MDTVNIHSLLARRTFTSMSGTRLDVDAAGITTKMLLTDGANSYRLRLQQAQLDGAHPILTATNGYVIQIRPEDVPEMAALLAANAPRQRQTQIARIFFFVALAFMLLVITILTAGFALIPITVVGAIVFALKWWGHRKDAQLMRQAGNPVARDN
jgi:hypothetical protein